MKKTQPITRRKWTIIVVAFGICILSVLNNRDPEESCTENDHWDINEKINHTTPKCSEVDSGQEKTHYEATATFIIGLPF